MSHHGPFEPNTCYHLFNHAVGNENLFRSTDNYRYFLTKYAYYSASILDTYAYCLMPNHFHFLIRIKDQEALARFFETKVSSGNPSTKSISNQIGQQLGNWLNAYAKAYNKKFERRGSLFVERVRRIKVSDEQYFIKLLHYINLNPIHHGFVDDPADWAFSSFNQLKHAALSKNAILKLRKLPDQYRELIVPLEADDFFESIEFY